jgi:hypothetical protein
MKGVRFFEVLRILREIEDDSNSARLTDDFTLNREVVVQNRLFGPQPAGSYKECVPKDARSFVSRCSAFKRYNKYMSMERIVREQYARVILDSNRLHREVMGLMEQGHREMQWRRTRESLLEDWHENAARDTAHSYHPDDMPEPESVE